MKKCPYCAEEIQDEAIKCRHCGETLSIPETAKESHRLSLPFMFWLAEIAGIAVFASRIPDMGYKVLFGAGLYAITAPIVWQIADWVRKYAAPTVYFGSGFFDMIGKKFFWTYGPQLISLTLLILFFLTQLNTHRNFFDSTSMAGKELNSVASIASSHANNEVALKGFDSSLVAENPRMMDPDNSASPVSSTSSASNTSADGGKEENIKCSFLELGIPCQLEGVIDKADWPLVRSALTFCFQNTFATKVRWTNRENGHSGMVNNLGPSSASNCSNYQVTIDDKGNANAPILACKDQGGYLTVK